MGNYLTSVISCAYWYPISTMAASQLFCNHMDTISASADLLHPFSVGLHLCTTCYGMVSSFSVITVDQLQQ